ncbi:MAG: LytTR family transcriptional regulator [Gammaproteobacteria bacterium]|nr:LytTR family transcriptional regulator [Gammaproteobacteria bacterium]
MTLERYLRHRRAFEVGMWAVFFLVNFLANSVVVSLDLQKMGLDTPAWKPVVWEGTSGLVLALLIPVMLAFDRRFPIQRGGIGRGLAAHALFTVPWSLLHVGGMVLLRTLAYLAAGEHYRFGDLPDELFYEYLKDFRGYAGFLALVYLYRFILRRAQGEAQFLAEGTEDAPAVQQPVIDRFLVKKLGREFLVRVADVDWIEASGNYVNLRVGTRAYPLRETMAGIEARLADAGFMRVHRSAIVNLDRVQEIVPFDTGDGEAKLAGDIRVPVSRRYRKELRDRFGSLADCQDRSPVT